MQAGQGKKKGGRLGFVFGILFFTCTHPATVSVLQLDMIDELMADSGDGGGGEAAGADQGDGASDDVRAAASAATPVQVSVVGFGRDDALYAANRHCGVAVLRLGRRCRVTRVCIWSP